MVGVGANLKLFDGYDMPITWVPDCRSPKSV
jgi:hypothetical protein